MSVLLTQFAGYEDDLVRLLETLVRTEEITDTLPWSTELSPPDRARLRHDLALLLAEPETTGELLDWSEVEDVLAEFAGLAGWDGPLLGSAPQLSAEPVYRIEVRRQDLRLLERASPAVRQVAQEVLSRFLPLHPTAGDRLTRGQFKRLPDRGLWQIDLPDGYRLRFFLDEGARTVHVVYLGPHPEGEVRGREERVRAAVNRVRCGG